MFKQDSTQLETKCKGCANHCKLSCTTENEQYYPIIGDKILYSHLNENGIEITLYESVCASASDALNLGLNLSTICDHYSHRFAKYQRLKTKIQTICFYTPGKETHKAPQGFSQELPTPALMCQGCKQFCTIDFTVDQQNNYFPTINNKLIESYTNPLTGAQEFILKSKCRSEQAALNLAQKISRLCKHYRLTKAGYIK